MSHRPFGISQAQPATGGQAARVQALAEAVAERAGRDPGDFAVRVLAGAIVGIAMAAWFEVADDLVDYMDQGRLATFADKFERGLALLEAGLPL